MISKARCVLLVLALAVALAGCAKRPVEVIQREMTEALEEQAKVIASDMPVKEKVAKAKAIAARIVKLADEAKQRGDLNPEGMKKIAESRDRAYKAAEDLKRAVGDLEKKTPS